LRSPKIILEILTKFENKNVDKLYRYLYNPEFYKIAYQNIYSKPAQMTRASDGSTIDGMSEERINKIINKLKDNSYQPTPLRRVQIPKKSGGTRPISVPSFEDKLIQEVLRMILEALYEGSFSEHSHGFRPNKSCHTALWSIKGKFQGTKWWIDADISKCFDNINHEILLKTLRERIKDLKFIHLINKFLKAGYIENWTYHKTYSGTPQGSIISPILANIYLDKFDKYMEGIIKEFNCGMQRKSNKEYVKWNNKANKLRQKIKQNKDIEASREEYRKAIKEREKYPRCEYNDASFKRLYYIRYADDFLVGVIGTRKETESINIKIKEFLKKYLNLEMNMNKTKIIHHKDKVLFLGYEIATVINDKEPTLNGKVFLWVPYQKMVDFIIKNGYGKWFQDKLSGKQRLKAIHNTNLVNVEELEILLQYNTKIRGLYNYYQLASNVCKMNNFNYVCQLSFLRTLSLKYRTTCAKLYKNKNYYQNKHIGITHKNKFYEFFNGPFNVVKYIKFNKEIDAIININKYFSRNSLLKRMEANMCEYCQSTTGPFEVHHIRKLKDLKGKTNWEKLMASRNRKTMVLCRECHHKLHNNKLG